MISPDWTLIASALIFLLTLVGFNQLLLQPLLRVLEQRKARTIDVVHSASQEGDRYHALVSEYEQRIKEERQAGYRRADEVRSEAVKARQAQVAETRQQAQEMVGEARKRIEEELESARGELKGEAEQIAALIAGRVLESR